MSKEIGSDSLTAEITRLESLFKADKLIRDQYSAISQTIAREERELQTLKTRLADHEGAAVRRTVLQQERADAYERVFDAIIAEEVELAALYAPLRKRLGAASGTLSKLEFSVFRTADAASWAETAEETLLDRRQAGDFKGAYILNLTGSNPALASVGTNVTQWPMTGKPLFGDRIAAKTGAAAAGEPARQAKYVSPFQRVNGEGIERDRFPFANPMS